MDKNGKEDTGSVKEEYQVKNVSLKDSLDLSKGHNLIQSCFRLGGVALPVKPTTKMIREFMHISRKNMGFGSYHWPKAAADKFMRLGNFNLPSRPGTKDFSPSKTMDLFALCCFESKDWKEAINSSVIEWRRQDFNR